MKTLVTTFQEEANNDNLPYFDAMVFEVNRTVDNDNARVLIANGGSIILPEGMSMTGDNLPVGTTYSGRIAYWNNVTDLTVGYNVKGLTMSNLPVNLQTLTLKSSSDNKQQVTGNVTDLPLSLKEFVCANPGTTLTPKVVTSYARLLNIEKLSIGNSGLTGDFIDFAALQIANGRTSASIVLSGTFIQNNNTILFNGTNYREGNTRISWEPSDNNYIVSLINETTSAIIASVTITVDSFGNWTVVI